MCKTLFYFGNKNFSFKTYALQSGIRVAATKPLTRGLSCVSKEIFLQYLQVLNTWIKRMDGIQMSVRSVNGWPSIFRRYFFLSLYILEIATKSCICFTLRLTEVYFIFYKKIRFNFDIALNIDIENETESKQISSEIYIYTQYVYIVKYEYSF